MPTFSTESASTGHRTRPGKQTFRTRPGRPKADVGRFQESGRSINSDDTKLWPALGREMMLERQRDGIAKAKKEGRYKGRKPTARAKAPDVLRLAEKGHNPSEIAKALGIGRASVYRALAAPHAA